MAPQPKRSPRHAAALALLDALAAEYLNAPIIEINHEHWDVFARAWEQVTVELCHGRWRTFMRGASGSVEHLTRDAAREYARRLLGGA